MMDPSDDDFIEDNPLAAPVQPDEGQSSSRTKQPLRRRARGPSRAAGDAWEQAMEKAGLARERTELFLRENPIPMILGALAAGLVIGLAIRYASRSEEKEVEIKSPLGHVNLGFLSLPFLWPFFKSLRERYEDSAEAVKEGVGRLKKIDIDRYAKPIRKRWKTWTH
jgi:ElaB/YqjD/DUF883 family membrane-anchored ribosome-binding protein